MRIAIRAIGLVILTLIQIHLPIPTWAAEIIPPTAAKSAVRTEVYKLRVKDHWMANKTIKDLVLLLGGTARYNVLKGSRPQTIRMELSLPQDQSAYFLSKLSGLGNLTPSPSDSTRTHDLQNGRAYRMSIDIFDP